MKQRSNNQIDMMGGLENLYKIATFGFHHRQPKAVKRFMLLQLICSVAIFLVYLKFNEGLIPWFLRAKPPPRIHNPDTNILEYFPEAGQDGINIVWSHGTNREKTLMEAMKGQPHMIEADLILKGQGTDHQSLVPIMAHPPETDSDLTFSTFLEVALANRKGIKLDFKKMEAVEITMQKLKAEAHRMHIPVWLNANILKGPNEPADPPLDINRFLRIATDNLPKSTLSLAWTTNWTKNQSNKGYDWPMVKEMHDYIEKWSIKQPISFAVRASLMVNSIAPLKWLMEMTDGTISIFSPAYDDVIISHLLYVRYRFPAHKVFYDLPPTLAKQFEEYKDDTLSHIPIELLENQAHIFNSKDWNVRVRNRDGATMYLGTESIVMSKGLLVSKDEHLVQTNKPITYVGKVEFLDVSAVTDKDYEHIGLEVFLRVTDGSTPSRQPAIHAFLGIKGDLLLNVVNIPIATGRDEGKIATKSQCFRFKITDDYSAVTFTVWSDCTKLDHKESVSKTLTVSAKNVRTDTGYTAIKGGDTDVFAVVEEFKIITNSV